MHPKRGEYSQGFQSNFPGPFVNDHEEKAVVPWGDHSVLLVGFGFFLGGQAL